MIKISSSTGTDKAENNLKMIYMLLCAPYYPLFGIIVEYLCIEICNLYYKLLRCHIMFI